MKIRLKMIVAVGALALVGSVASVLPASADTSSFCGLTWGSVPGTGGTASSNPVTNVRGGRHECFDRLVIDIRGATSGYDVRYVPAVYEDGSGNLVPLRGGAFLQIAARNPAYDGNGNPTYDPANPRELVGVAGWRTFRQVAWAGSFEGTTTVGLGVRARLPFRVFTLAGPGGGSRLVVDVAHRW